MSDIINILPDSVANQIAAGEVVDRPASAVKELLENAIDAGASHIQLIIKDAGRTLLQVIDDGCGMSDSDARLCFERHATSKIHRADDLFAIRTMGFRGEALASIAAVAQVELKTRQHDNELGSCILIEGSDVKSQQACSCAVGTSIAVRNLFFNIPARRNFLKKDSIELSHIDDIFRRVAIVNNQIGFSVYSNGKLLYDLHASNKAQRIAAIFGMGSTERLYPVNESTDVVQVSGYVGKPENVRRTRGEQYIFVNNRYIKHFALSAAVEKAYAELIPERTYPGYFLFIEVDPSRIDVNIHPTKTEIRFVDEHAIFAIVRAATKKALGQFSLATEIEFNPSTEIDFSPAPKGYNPSQPHVNYNPSYNPFNPQSSNTSNCKPSHSQWETFFDDNPTHTQSPPEEDHTISTEPTTSTTISLIDDAIEPTSPTIKPIESSTPNTLTFQNRYIISTIKSGILIVDQQRAHERILFEQLMSRQQHTSKVGAQQLLFPVNCTFSPADAELLNEMLDDLRHLGFALDPMGNTTFVVTATPPNMEDSQLQTILDQLICDYKSSMMQKFNDRDRALCASLARQMAVKVGTTLQAEERQSLLAELFACQVPNLSPSGKKTMYILNDNELIEKMK